MTTQPPPFEIRPSHRDAALILTVVGEVDMATAPGLNRALGSVAEGTKRVVIDLVEVSFLDSSALNALVQCKRLLAERDVTLRVVSPTDPAVRRVFEITHLAADLNLVDSLDEALA